MARSFSTRPAAPQLNRSHPLGAALAAGWFLSGSGQRPLDVGTPTTPTTISTLAGTSGPYGAAAAFDGGSNYYAFTTAPVLNPNRNFTIYVVVRYDGTTANQGIYSAGNSGIYLRWSNQKLDALKSNQADLGSSTTAVADTRWHHVAITVSADATATVQFYLDGHPDGSVTTTQTFATIAPNNSIGSDTTAGTFNEFLNGAISHVFIFNRALRPEEVAQLSVQPFALLQAPARRAVNTAAANTNGTATLAALSTVTALGSITGSATLVAVSTLTGKGSVSGTATLQAVSTVTGLGSVSGTATLAAVSTVTGLGQVTGTATIQAVSTLTATGPNPAGIATLVANSTVTGLGTVTGKAALAAVATVTGLGQVTGQASLQAIATVTATGQTGANAALVANSTVTAQGIVTGKATLASTSTVAALGSVAGTASLGSVSTVTANGMLAGQAVLQATSTITAKGIVTGSAALQAQSTVTATGPAVTTGFAALLMSSLVTATGSYGAAPITPADPSTDGISTDALSVWPQYERPSQRRPRITSHRNTI